ncbi:MAG: hypothetical protein NT138_01935 [Planctomycetales bacterium]|nr:hypothetical protein [Planctomycetales bacterium]
MPEFTPQTPESPDQQALFELLSRHYDGDLGAAESERLATLESAHREASENFRRQAGMVSCLLKGIPVCSVQALLFETPVTTTPRATSGPDPAILPRRSGAQRVVVGAVTSLLCAGLLLALNQTPDDAGAPMLAKADRLHGTMEARGGSGSPMDSGSMMEQGRIMSDAMSMPMAADVPPNALLGAAAIANTEAAGDTNTEASSALEVQPLIQSDDWNVVVVRIDGKDRDQAMDQIQSIVQKAGLQLKGSAGPDESRWLGVVLTSNVVGREDVVNAMESVGASNGYVTETPPADSQEAMFIAAARESLKHPTRSELHHGKVFVVLPLSPLMNGDEQTVAANPQVAATGRANATSPWPVESSAVDSEGSAAKSARISATAVPAVTLVVFEFSDVEKSGPNNSRQQI